MKGNTVKGKCLKNEFIKAITFLTRTGKVVLLHLTGLGIRLVKNNRAIRLYKLGCKLNIFTSKYIKIYRNISIKSNM